MPQLPLSPVVALTSWKICPCGVSHTDTQETRRRVLNKLFAISWPPQPHCRQLLHGLKCKRMQEGWPLFCLLPSDQKAWLGRLVDQELASIISRPSIVLGPFGPLKLLSQILVLDSGAFVPVYVNYFEHKFIFYAYRPATRYYARV